jgi:type IV pilus assembly protein PilC
MATFVYLARDKAGQAVNGTVTADTEADALQLIRGEGKFPVSLRVAGAGDLADVPEASSKGIRISRADVIQLSTQLAVMVETGVQLPEALECIAKQSDRTNVRELVADLEQQIQSGVSFSEALTRHRRSFPVIYIALMKASEKTGMLSRLLNRATQYLRDEQEIVRKVRGALVYPGIMFTFALGTTTFLLTFVLPRFTVIYANKKAALPAPTQLLMALSEYLVTNWVTLAATLITAFVFGSIYFRTSGGARLWHHVQLHVPLLGKLYRKLHLARGLRMVGTMAGAGVALLECVNIAHELCANSHFKNLWKSVADQIQAGRAMSEPLFENPLVPRSVAQMIFSGEKGGKLAQVMEQVAAYAEDELKEQVTNLTRYIEPLMIVVMGVIIGGVALALLLPVFTISRVMSH